MALTASLPGGGDELWTHTQLWYHRLALFLRLKVSVSDGPVSCEITRLVLLKFDRAGPQDLPADCSGNSRLFGAGGAEDSRAPGGEDPSNLCAASSGRWEAQRFWRWRPLFVAWLTSWAS